jgi:hypothetical protein
MRTAPLPLADHTGRSPLYKGFQKCCRKILSSGQNGANMSFAKSYAQAGLHLSTTAGIKTQAAYIRANLQGYRDPDAKEIRKALEAISQGQVYEPTLVRSSESKLAKGLDILLNLKDLEE